MVGNLTADGQNFEKAKQKIANMKKEMVIVKAENKDLQGKLKITLSEIEVKQASLNEMNTGLKTLTNILCSQKSHFDRRGLGYNHGAFNSYTKGICFKYCIYYSTCCTC